MRRAFALCYIIRHGLMDAPSWQPKAIQVPLNALPNFFIAARSANERKAKQGRQRSVYAGSVREK